MRGRKSFLPGIFLLLFLLFFCVIPSRPDSRYYQRVVFDNSLNSDAYFDSGGKVPAPGSLQLAGGKMPVESGNFFTGPNALRLQWTSKRGSGWEAEIRVPEWRNRETYFPATLLYFWCSTATAIEPGPLPHLALQDHAKELHHTA